MLSQRSLEAFRAVIECGTVSGAAENLHVSQPAVSRLIKDLEDRTGLQLFTRFGGKIVPTPEARELAVEIDRSFIGLSAIEKAARDIKVGKRSTISISAMPAIAHSVLSDTLVSYQRERPDFRVSLQSMQTHNVVRKVATRASQLGFTSPTHHEYDIDLIRTIKLPYCCILREGHELTAKAELSFDDFSGQNVVAFERSTATGTMMERAFAQMTNPPEITVSTHLSTLVSGLVLRGMGISIVDPFTAAAHRTQGGIVRPFADAAEFSLAIIRPRGQSLGPDLSAFLEQFERELIPYKDGS